MQSAHPIRRQVVLTCLYTAAEQTITPDSVHRGESNDFYELVLCLGGVLGVTSGADSYILSAGDALLHAPMEFHSMRAEAGTSPLLLRFSFEATRMPRFSHRVFTTSDEGRIRAARALELLKSAAVFENDTPVSVKKGHEREAQEAINELEIFLLTLSEKGGGVHVATGTAGMRNYRHALAVLEENLTKPLNTAQLAQLCNMSPSLLKKTFSHYAGVGVMEYFRTRKINASIPLLRTGNSVQDVAAKFGFADAGYFSTVFRRVTGHTPSFYRNH